MSRRAPPWLAAAWPAVVASALLSLPWLPSPLFLDDWHLLQRAHDAPWTWDGLVQAFTFLDRRSIETWNLPPQPAYTYFRPLVVASFKLDLALFGLSPAGMHLTNLLLHLASVAMVAAIALRLGGDGRTARTAALLFGLQPQNAVVVIWTAGRTEAMVTALMLAGFLAWLAAREKRKPGWLAIAVGFQVLACLSKESAVLLPACIVAHEAAVRMSAVRRAGTLRNAVLWASPVLLVGAAYTAWRLAFFTQTGTLVEPYYLSPATDGFLSFFGVKVVYYVLSLFTTAFVVPVFGVEFLLGHPAALTAAVLAAVGLLVLVLRGRWRNPLALLGLLWLGASLVPTAPLPTIDLYLYFGSIGFAFLLAVALQPSPLPQERGEGSRCAEIGPERSEGCADVGRDRSEGAADGRPSPAQTTHAPPSASCERRPDTPRIEPSPRQTAGRAVRPRDGRRRLLQACLALYAIGFLGRGFFYREEGVVNQRIYDDIRADAPEGFPAGTRLLLVNMPFTAAHIAPMARLESGQPAITAMLVTVSTQWANPTWRAEVDCLDDRRLRVRPPAEQGAFFASPEEWNLHELRVRIEPERTYRAEGLRVRPVSDGGRVVALDVELDRPLSQGLDRVYVFHDDGRRIAHRQCSPGSSPSRRDDEPPSAGK